MTTTKRTATLAGLLALAGATAPGAGAAQDVANNATFGDWVVNCVAVKTRQTTCRLVHTLTRTDEGSLIVRLVGMPAEDGSAVLFAQVPMGVYLPGSGVFRPEAADGSDAGAAAAQTQMIWQRCLGEVCEAAVALPEETLATFTETGSILFGYRMNPDAEPIIVRVDVSRFAEGMAAITPGAGE